MRYTVVVVSGAVETAPESPPAKTAMAAKTALVKARLSLAADGSELPHRRLESVAQAMATVGVDRDGTDHPTQVGEGAR